jgi:ADP-ribose pyrophosphatase YjhB (NUDIX family)
MYSTDLTVGAIIEQEGRFLLVKERAMGREVISQPGGHIEAGESPEAAVVRETLEETACTIECNELVGIYLWIHPQTRQQFLRLNYAARFISCNESRPLDEGIIDRRWMTLSDLQARRATLRSPVVLRCVQDFVAGRRESDALLTGMLPLQQNVHKVLATADLV